MAHNIMQQDRFLSLRRPAWHGLGMVVDEEMGAVDAFRRIGEVVITTEPLFTPSGLATNHKAIISEAFNKELGKVERQVCSVVTEGYNEITHADFCGAWDGGTKQHVETLGILGKGETLFITTKMPTFSVKGEETDNYLLAYSPLSGIEAVTLRITPVRVVCQNTLILSGSQCSAQYRVAHTSDMAKSVQKFLAETWNQIEAKAEAVKEALEFLAGHRVTFNEGVGVVKSVYPSPVKPDVSPYSDEGLKKLATWEAEKKRMEEHQLSVVNLWGGGGVGMDSAACAGTAYGLFNAVVEYEDHSKKHRRAASGVFGAGADRKQKAHAELMALARG